MTILNINPDYTGQVGILPRTVKVICNDSFATVTSAGYLNSSTTEGYNYYPTDIFLVSYLNNAFGIFQPTFSGTTITLVDWVNPGTVALSGSLVAGNVVEALNATTIEDSAVALSALQLKANIKAVSVSWAGGGTSNAFTVTGITTSSIVVASIFSTANAVTIESAKVLAPNALTVTFSADPGATVLNVIAFIVAQ